jgi:hypothetical protein
VPSRITGTNLADENFSESEKDPELDVCIHFPRNFPTVETIRGVLPSLLAQDDDVVVENERNLFVTRIS